MAKIKILVLGPMGCGKTRISNYLADASNGLLPAHLRSTRGVRILDYDVPNLKTQQGPTNVEVQLWDCGGDERYMTCWPAFRKDVNGIAFVYSPHDPNGMKVLEAFYNYFVTQQNFSLRQCIVFSCNADHSDDSEIQQAVKLPSVFSRISQASVNLDTSGEKLRYDFNQFLISVVNSINTQ